MHYLNITFSYQELILSSFFPFLFILGFNNHVSPSTQTMNLVRARPKQNSWYRVCIWEFFCSGLKTLLNHTLKEKNFRTKQNLDYTKWQIMQSAKSKIIIIIMIIKICFTNKLNDGKVEEADDLIAHTQNPKQNSFFTMLGRIIAEENHHDSLETHTPYSCNPT